MSLLQKPPQKVGVNLRLKIVIKKALGPQTLDVPLVQIFVGKQAHQNPRYSSGCSGNKHALGIIEVCEFMCSRPPPGGVGEVEDRGVVRPIRHTKQSVVFRAIRFVSSTKTSNRSAFGT